MDLLPFNRSDKPTLGLEWELALVDPVTRDLVPRAPEIVQRVAETHPDIHIEREFLANTVELVTSVCETVPEAVEELRRGLHAVRSAAAELGLRVWTAGSHPFSDWQTQPVSEKGTYTEIIERTQFWGRQMLIWGIHAHVGIRHEDRVWPLIHALMTCHPHMLALSSSSPGWGGLDTGYASNRTMLYQQLPTAGLPPQIHSWEEWSSYMKDQSRSGVINHTGSMHLDIRPAGKWGTVELRVCDSVSSTIELAALSAFMHCLVVYFDEKIDRGEPLPSLQPWHVEENKWRAARYGMDAIIIKNRDTDEILVREDLEWWVRELGETAQKLGCYPQLCDVSQMIYRTPNYARQRELYRVANNWNPAVDAICDEIERD